jgi:hypothetical protein
MGQPLRPPIGAFQRGGFLGYYLWFPIVFPLFVSAFTGRVKSRPVSAFVGVNGEDIRALRARRPEASAVCRKAAGMPGRVETPSSHCQPHSAILSPCVDPWSVHICGSTCPWTSWTPWRSTSNGVAGGRVEGAGGRVGR